LGDKHSFWECIMCRSFYGSGPDYDWMCSSPGEGWKGQAREEQKHSQGISRLDLVSRQIELEFSMQDVARIVLWQVVTEAVKH